MEDGETSKRHHRGGGGKGKGGMKQPPKPKAGSFQAMRLSYELFRGVGSSTKYTSRIRCCPVEDGPIVFSFNNRTVTLAVTPQSVVAVWLSWLTCHGCVVCQSHIAVRLASLCSFLDVNTHEARKARYRTKRENMCCLVSLSVRAVFLIIDVTVVPVAFPVLQSPALQSAVLQPAVCLLYACLSLPHCTALPLGYKRLMQQSHNCSAVLSVQFRTDNGE